jgi:hypothetical protein
MLHPRLDERRWRRVRRLVFAPVDGNESKRPIEQIASVLSATFPLPHKFSTADIDEDACNPLDVEEVYSPLLEGWYAIKIKFDMALFVTVSPVHSRF